MSHIVVPHSFEVQEVQRVFPEATVWAIDDDVAALNRCVYDHQGRFSFIGDLAVPLAQHLGQMGPLARDALPALLTLANDPDPDAAAAARTAIAAIDPPPVKRP